MILIRPSGLRSYVSRHPINYGNRISCRETTESQSGVQSSTVTAIVSPQSATCRSSVEGRGQSREKLPVGGEPAGHELREEPHAGGMDTKQ